MKKIGTIIFWGIFTLMLAGCQATPPSETTLPTTEPAPSMTEAEAKVIAEQNCIKGGESLEPGTYNANSKTWWFDANLNATKPGCNPACVVFEETKVTEINWRCTGLIPPTESDNDSVSEAIRQLFADKYTKYADTISVQIAKATENHVRGSITFEEGAPGGLFLAVNQEGVWKVVHEGNGQIPCTLSEYDFPAEMLTDCAPTN